MRFFFLIVILFFSFYDLLGQCDCIDCPEPLQSGISGGVISQIEISGATNPTIGTNGQGLRSVRLHLVHASLEEIDVILRKGGPFNFSRLIEQNGNSTSDTVTLEICFINCDEMADPDPGFPATFDSGAGYGPNQIYTGSYFPSQGVNGCFNNTFDGITVNGIWELAISGSPTFGGTLVNWELDFYDNDGTICEPFCIIPVSDCDANSGDIVSSQFTFCEGAPSLNLDIPVDFSGDEPDPSEFDYYFVIADEDGVIIDLQEDPDLTDFDPGTYSVCGLSVLTEDFPLIPLPNGSFSLVDLEEDIENEVYCADLSSDCWTIIIVEDDFDPQISGPDTVCVNELVTFTLEGLPVEDWTSGSVEGPFLNLEFNLPDIEVAWAPGSDTREICYSFSNVCTTGTVCKEVFIIQPPVFSISGPLEVCEGVTYFYEIDPPAPAGTSWDVTLTGGNVISVSNDGFEAEWFENGGSNFAVIVLTGGPCGDSPPNTISVELVSVDLPDLILPDELCIDDEGIVSVPFDPLVDDYFWSGNGITILSGQGTNGPVAFSVDQLGVVEVCLDIITSCGAVDPLCETINVIEPPSPEITALDPQCEFEFTLIADIGAGSTGQWTLSGGPGGVDIISPQNSSTDVVVSESGVYIFEFTEDNGSCEGSTEIEVEILPSPEVEEGDIFCAGGEYEVELIISGGTEPYFVDGVEISGTLFLSDPINSGDPYFFIITDSNGCETIAEGLIECPCIADAGTMSAEQINICISSGQPATGIHNGDATFDINDIGVFILHDNPGTTLGNIIEINDTGVFNFQAGIVPGQTYYISYVVGLEDNGNIDLGDPCLSVSFGQEVIFYEDPVAEIVSSVRFCLETGFLEADISADVTQISWTQTDGPATANILNPNLAFTQVIFDEAGIYVFELTVSNPACDLVVEWELEVFANPIILDLETECVSSGLFIFNFEIQGSGEDFSINLPGTISGNEFVSDTLEAEIQYVFTITDELGCSAEFSVDPVFCNCLSSSGTMSGDSIVICETELLIALDFNFDADVFSEDTAVFIIHEGDGQELINPVFITNSLAFSIPDTLQRDQWYFISHVSGPQNAEGINLDDPCLDVSLGQPLFIYSVPVFELPEDESICLQDLIIEFSGDGLFELIENSNDVSVDFVFQNDSLSVQTDAASILIFEYNETNGLCGATDSLRIELFEPPFVENIETTCIADQFFGSFEISGGNSPYFVNGTEIDGDFFITDTVMSETVITFEVVDNNGCSAAIVELTEDCACIARTGEFQIDELELCEGEEVDLSVINLQGTVDDEDFELFFVLHDGYANEIGNILAISQGDPIEWSADLESGRAYFITAIISTSDDGGINFDDPCIDFSVGIPVIWLLGPTVEISGSVEICLGENLFLIVESEGPFPFNIELLSSAGETINVQIIEPNQQVNLPQNVGENTWEINTVESECVATFSGEFIAIVSEPLELNFFTASLICNNALFGSTLDLNELIIGGAIDGVWIFDGEELVDGVIDFDGFDPGQYEFFFSTEGFEDPCPGNSWLVLIDVIGCDCPPVSLPTALRICSDFDPIPLMDMSGEAVEGVWTLNNPNSNNPVPVIEDGFLITDLAVSGVFELIFTVTDSLPEECTSEYTVILEIEEFKSAGEVIGRPVELCESESNEVNLFDYLTGFSEGGVWLDENREIIGGIVDLSDSDLPLNTFYYLVEGEGLCSSDEVEVNIALLSAPEYEIITINPTCAGENNGSIIVENLDSENPITIAFLDGNAVTADDLTLLSAGTYTLQLVGANACSGVVEVIEIIDPPQYNLSLGDDLELDFLETTTIEFTTDIPDSLVSSIFWSDDSGIIAENTPQITFVAETETTISVLLISVDNCILEDELRIFLGEKDIYIPNVFRPASDIEANARFGPLGTQSIEQINQFSIFDRWGNRVHEIKDLAPDHPAVFWDGRIDGQNAHEAVYVYQLIYVDFRGATTVKAGDFVLLR